MSWFTSVPQIYYSVLCQPQGRDTTAGACMRVSGRTLVDDVVDGVRAQGVIERDGHQGVRVARHLSDGPLEGKHTGHGETTARLF